jgi:hypothetical protein
MHDITSDKIWNGVRPNQALKLGLSRRMHHAAGGLRMLLNEVQYNFLYKDTLTNDVEV